MNINMNSWHYWLVMCFFVGRPSTLCGYFWRLLIAACVLTPLTVLVGLMGVIVIIYPVLFLTFTSSPLMSCIAFPMMLSWTFLMMLLCPTLFFDIANEYVKGTIFDKELRLGKKSFCGKQNILLSYIAAQKQKICPLIYYTREEK